MKLENIQSEWSKDSTIDPSNLLNEAMRGASLHSKYWNILSKERLIYVKLTEDLKQLKHDKFWWLMHGDDEVTISKGWRLPPKGQIVIKDEAKGYVEVDQDVVSLTLKVSMQKEKIEFLESIIKSISSRSFDVKNYIEWSKFQSGIG